MNLASYESIKSSIVLDFEEYIEEEGLSVAQVSAKTLEEDWRIVNDNFFRSWDSTSIAVMKCKRIS
ncbi:hypothetical protein ACFQ5D_20885 [Paenibacillus farraposensis]|uniref:Uncharacterized protein n=1 Tax=Paenibacillus farraposensis TaxID=2807095 RepID=A0ABW4DKG6_9BACL